MNYKYLLTFFIALCCNISGISAQSQTKVVERRLKSYFQSYKSPDAEIGGCKLVRFQLNPQKRTLVIHANANFGYQPFRPETTERIYADIRKVLPGPVNYYKLTVLVGGKSIDDLIPNTYRKVKDETRLWSLTQSRGVPWVTNASLPYRVTEGLQGHHLAVTPSHGRYYKNDENRWKWQRPPFFCTREDLLSQSIVVPYLTPMLEQAGAIVFSARERDRQPFDIIVDNDANMHNCGRYAEEHSRRVRWEQGASGFACPEKVLYMGDNPFTLGSSRIINTTSDEKKNSGAAIWTPDIPERGNYAVYVTYQSFPSSVPDAQYLIMHLGGVTQINVNQQIGGGTWVYLGTYEFAAGQLDRQMVVLTNYSSHVGVVSADAVRFGGGSAIVSRGSADAINTSCMPRYYEGARYQGQWAGFPADRYANYQGEKDYAEDINSRSLLANYLLGGSVYCPDSVGKGVPIELALGLHTDAGIREDDTTVGCLGIYTTDNKNNKRLGDGTLSRYASRDLTDMVQSAVVEDVNRLLPQPLFSRRGMWDRNYSESRLPDVPSTIIELLSHQNFADMRYAHDPHFKFIASRAIYKGLLRYTATMHGKSKYAVQPLPVQAFAVDFLGEDRVRISWRPTHDAVESTAAPTGYILYCRVDNAGWDNGRYISSTACEVTLERGRKYDFKVAAVNRGGASFPSEVLTAYVAKEHKGKVLIVNGFQRVDGPAVINTSNYAGFDLLADPGVPYMGTTAYSGLQREFSRSQAGYYDEAQQLGASGDELAGTYVAGNTFDYASVHGDAIKAAGYSFVSCSRMAFEQRLVSSQGFDVVDVYMGLQRERGDAVLSRPAYWNVTPAMYALLSEYTSRGGALLVSGSYLGEESKLMPSAQFLLSEVLHAKCEGYVADWSEQGVCGLNRVFDIPRWVNPEHYAVTRPEVLSPISDKAFTPFVYEHSRFSASVAYEGSYRSVTLGFPFESIRSAQDRNLVMSSLLQFLTGF